MDRALTTDVVASSAAWILDDLLRDGFRVELLGDGALSIAPRSRLTAAQMTAIADHKVAITAVLRCRDLGVAARRALFRQQCEAAPAGTVPRFLFRVGVSYQRGVCFSCADPLPAHRFGRCWRCALAWRLATKVAIPGSLATALDAAKVLG